MSEEVKKGTGLRIALIVVSILFVVSLIANLYLYTRQYGLENQITDLQSQVFSLKAPKLVTRLSASDQRPLFQTPYFHVYGEVWNVGTNMAYNCKLHIIIYQGAVVAEDTYINLGIIEGEDFASVDSKVYYEGSALTDWSIIPEWWLD